MFEKLDTITRIIEKIKRFPVTFESMKEWIKHENIDISDRTLYRYLEKIKYIPLNDGQIVTIDGDYNKKTWKFVYDNSEHELNEQDIRTFFLFKNLLPKWLLNERKNSIQKIEENLYKVQSKSKFEYHQPAISKSEIATSKFGEYAYEPEHQKNLEDFIWAVQYKRKINLLQLAQDKIATPHLVLPMQLVYHNNLIYLLAISEQEAELKLRTIDISQILSYKIEDAIFNEHNYVIFYYKELSKRFGIEENLDEHEYEIILEFCPALKDKIINRFWHPTQQIITLENDHVQLKLNCGLNAELINWIMQWSDNIKIKKPFILSDLVKDWATTVLSSTTTNYPSFNLL